MRFGLQRITATDASRKLSSLLSRVENGSQILIQRHSSPVALLKPPDSAPRRISDCIALRVPRDSACPDSDFGMDLDEVLRG